ncbi:MAG: HEPN domain-containing protein [Anaerolineales bacterium]|nr:HEPN domain-containing protein [Anaerolineales bacterium]
MEDNLHSEEVRLYLESARRDLEAAQSNLESGYYHIVISRAYYAMFYAASALLASKGIHCSKHSGVHSAFGEYFVKTGLIESEYSKLIGRAFEDRIDSDYDMISVADKKTAQATLEHAVRFVARADQYFEETR